MLASDAEPGLAGQQALSLPRRPEAGSANARLSAFLSSGTMFLLKRVPLNQRNVNERVLVALKVARSRIDCNVVLAGIDMTVRASNADGLSIILAPNNKRTVVADFRKLDSDPAGDDLVERYAQRFPRSSELDEVVFQIDDDQVQLFINIERSRQYADRKHPGGARYVRVNV